jgi:hypothetical protein
MSEHGLDTPASRTLAVVLRDLFAGTDDAVRMIVGTLGQPITQDPDRGNYVNATVAGTTMKVPYLSSRLYAAPAGTPLYLLATRSGLIVIGSVGYAGW